MKAVWNGAVVAESADTIVVEGNHYFPLESIRREFFRQSKHTTVCAWKGTARYYDLHVGSRVNRNAAWHYPAPSRAAQEIEGRVAFWQGVEIVP